LLPGIEGVSQSIAHQVDRHHGEKDEEPWVDNQPRPVLADEEKVDIGSKHHVVFTIG
jgi:hypothetical protein